jgi:acyl-CoA thioesterase-2
MSRFEGEGPDPLGLIRLDAVDELRFSGMCIDGRIGRVFGGQTLAQALRATSLALSETRAPNSLHAYFISPGRSDAPVEFAVAPIKSGRSLDVADVRAEQDGRTLLSAIVSFHGVEESIEFQVAMPDVPPPEDLESSVYRPPHTNPAVRAPFDIRYPPSTTAAGASRAPAQVLTWIRTHAPVRSDAPVDHAALLAHAVDFLLTRAAHVALDDAPAHIGASLDHAMWFHRPFRMDEWLMVSSEALTFAGSRSLCTAHIFMRDGRLVATASQEALIRDMPPRSEPAP